VREKNLDEMFRVFGEWIGLDVFLFERTSETRESLVSSFLFSVYHSDNLQESDLADLVHAQESLRQEFESLPLAKIQRRRNR